MKQRDPDGHLGAVTVHRPAIPIRAVISILLLVVSLVAVSETWRAEAAFEPFAPNSSWRSQVPADAAIDANSDAMVARMSRDNAMYANLAEFGIPIYQATPDTPRYSVNCIVTDWGACPFDGYQVPVPPGARPQSGSDGAMVVIDEPAGEVYEFWQATRQGDMWAASWGAVNDFYGSGWGGASTGSGASRLAGIVQVAEIAQGHIPHALAVQTDTICAGEFRAPALKTDGQSSRSDCVPEGARIRLDPAVDVASLDVTSGARTVARALQTYGAYVIDGGGAPLSLSFELDTASPDSIGNVYRQAGFRWDYDDMPGIPYDRLQVLA